MTKNKRGLLKAASSVLCMFLSAAILWGMLLGGGQADPGAQKQPVNHAVMDRYDRYMTNTISDALEGVLSIKKVYWLSDQDLVAPEPNPAGYGETDDPSSLQWLLDDAAELLDGQPTMFRTDIQLYRGSVVRYYLDETIFVISWRQLVGNVVYTFAEVKIADPSQFRRLLADGEYASGKQYVATEMATSVNAVLASNGDFYALRNKGIVVQDSQLLRADGRSMDSCLIDQNGDLRFVYAKELTTQEQIEAFVQENGVRFSISFGPVLIDNGQLRRIPTHYPVGEANVSDSRAALCQLGELHYLLAAANPTTRKGHGHTMAAFAQVLLNMGCQKVYNLDGGQSATLVLDDTLLNDVFQRKISDIIYFATAVPDGE